MNRRSDCELLRPSLVAFVHGEPHPETSQLLAHLAVCSACSQEEEELRGTLEFIELNMTPRWERGASGLGERRVQGTRFWAAVPFPEGNANSPRAWHLATGIAAAFLLCTLFLGGRDGARELSQELAHSAAVPYGGAASSARWASASFLGEDLDERLDSVNRGIQSLMGPRQRDAW